MYYLGIDCSTSVIGISLLDESSQIKKLDYIDLRKIDSFWEKADYAKKILEKLIIEHEIENIFIEESFSKFSPGMSSSATIDKLAKFNGLISYFVYNKFGTPPIAINVNHARKLCSIRIDRKDKSITTKEKVFVWFQKNYFWDFPLKKTGKPADCCFDMVDAFVICMAGIKEQSKN